MQAMDLTSNKNLFTSIILSSFLFFLRHIVPKDLFNLKTFAVSVFHWNFLHNIHHLHLSLNYTFDRQLNPIKTF